MLIKISSVYKCVEGCYFDEHYYIEKHIPMAKKILEQCGLIRIEADVFESIEGLLPMKYFAITHAFFKDDIAIADVFAHPGMADIVSDVANYTDVSPSLQTSRLFECE